MWRFTQDGQRLVGEPARRQAAINADGTIQAAKRKMGTDFKFKMFGNSRAKEKVVDAEYEEATGSRT